MKCENNKQRVESAIMHLTTENHKPLDDKNFEKALENLIALHDAGYLIYKDEKLKVALINGITLSGQNLLTYIDKLVTKDIPIDELLQNDFIYSRLLESVIDIETSVDIKDSVKNDLLFRATELGNETDVKKLENAINNEINKKLIDLIESGADITSDALKMLEGNGNISLDVLKVAIGNNLPKAQFELLVSKMNNADLDNALSSAAFYDKVDLQTVLIKKGADPNKLIPGGDDSLLIIAIKNKSADTVQNLLVSGANIHLQEEALQKALANSSEEIKSLVATYNSMERYFQKAVLPKIGVMATDLDKKADITDEYVIKELNVILNDVYHSNVSLQSISPEVISLDFVESIKISILSFFGSIGSDKSSEQIKFEKMAEAIYEKIKTTPEFKQLSTPIAGKTLPEFKKAVDASPENEKNPNDGVKGRFTEHILAEKKHSSVRQP